MDPFSIFRHQPTLYHLQWRKDFSIRQTTLYHGQDNRLKVAPKGSVIDKFFNSSNPGLAPPRRHEFLRQYLDQNGARSFAEALRLSPMDTRVLAMIDDRCDPYLKIAHLPESTSFLPMRQWESEEYMSRPPEGVHVKIYGADAGALYDHLNKNRKGVAERRIVHDTTHGNGPDFKRRIYASPSDAIIPIEAYSLPVAYGYFSDDSDCIYEAQLSLFVFGVDDYFWTAYFCEDSYFRKSNPVERSLRDEVDGPSFGLRMCKQPIWDPRYYFLSILSIRMSQVTMEWTVLVETLEGYLDKHGEINEHTLGNFLEDEPSLRKTKEYTWILSTLRRLRNSLARLLATWTLFDKNNSVCFNLDAEGALHDKFRECFYQIRQFTAELATLQMVLEQRIETLEKMSSVLVNGSSLAESITATRQGDNIRLLTYITIIYLPVTLVTGAFSMNQVSEDTAWWKYWVSMFCLTACTIVVAFSLQGLVPRFRTPRIPQIS